MCLAIPAKVIELAQDMATVEVGGVHRRISTLMVPELELGDYVITHAGFALHKVQEDDALASLELLRELTEKVPQEGTGE
ncbi:HypC/HybG/HupF family hydrogenase formation chaperone [Desulfoferula mesophila]|uniref:Hydrogenase assembly protein HupF n=1 Tax=Desulfoferula mesophila TaxID=3058419 RepID=A0AAU9EFM2_9BACT|nr:hydrogenase assembly protein HupF [Desulfoferula mesophilus]